MFVAGRSETPRAGYGLGCRYIGRLNQHVRLTFDPPRKNHPRLVRRHTEIFLANAHLALQAEGRIGTLESGSSRILGAYNLAIQELYFHPKGLVDFVIEGVVEHRLLRLDVHGKFDL